MSALPPKADIAERDKDVRFVPILDVQRFIRSPRSLARGCRHAVDGRVLLGLAGPNESVRHQYSQ
jgi:hypothetical protein